MDYFEEIVNAIEYAEKNLRDDVAVSDLTAVTGLSSWHFQRTFHELVGETIGSYLRRRRLACALEELRNTERKIIDVALDYQFGSPEAFSRAFKTEFGVSPLQLRSSSLQIVPFKKPALTRTKVEYILNQLELDPVIREVPARWVVGMPVCFASPLSKRSEYMASIPAVWQHFLRDFEKVEGISKTVTVGVIEGMASPRFHIHDDQMEYLACAPVDRKPMNLPDGFKAFEIPAGTYPVFQATGYHEQTQFMIDHVYSTWLPSAKYRRRDGPEYTWLDHTIAPLGGLMKVLFLVLAMLPACAHSQQRSQTSVPQFSAVVRSQSSTAARCPDAKPGEICKMTWAEAMEYCKSIGAHLPTGREYVLLLKPRHILVLEKAEVVGSSVPKDFYFVESLNPDGTYDAFYMNHKNYQHPADETENLLLWTSSTPPSHTNYAHVYYTEWGGGGGDPKDHLKTARNSVQCAHW